MERSNFDVSFSHLSLVNILFLFFLQRNAQTQKEEFDDFWRRERVREIHRDIFSQLWSDTFVDYLRWTTVALWCRRRLEWISLCIGVSQQNNVNEYVAVHVGENALLSPLVTHRKHLENAETLPKTRIIPFGSLELLAWLAISENAEVKIAQKSLPIKQLRRR